MMTIEECRRFYAQEVRFAAALHSEALVRAFGTVPREEYLGPAPWHIGSPDLRALSISGFGRTTYVAVDDARDLYHNVIVALDRDADINNGQPSALARWIEALELTPGDRVFHLGCGVGYYTAIMAELVGATGRVTGSEVDETLAERARRNFSGRPAVTIHAGDGARLDPGPCEAMLINAGVTHPAPQWLDRLVDGGRLVIPFTVTASPRLGHGAMMKIVRAGASWSAELVTPLAIYSCTTLRDPGVEPLIMKAFASGAFGQVRSFRTDAHDAGETCILHAQVYCFGRAATATENVASS